MRECVITNVKQPSGEHNAVNTSLLYADYSTDFMIRLARMHIPESHSGHKSMAFFPDGMEHPRYRGKKAGTASYMLCYKDVVEHFFQSKRELSSHSIKSLYLILDTNSASEEIS